MSPPRPFVLPLAAVGFVLAALAAYSSVRDGGWVWDDDSYVTGNANLETSEGLRRIWFEPQASPQYYPLVFTSFWIERQAFGLEPDAFRTTNVCLHALSAFLFWRLLVRLRVRGALLAAAVFLLHPVAVESVAWITERKNVLSLFLALSATHAWVRFRPLEPEGGGSEASASGGGPWLWALAFVLFGAALLAKTVTAPLPAVLLVLAWWKLGRVRAADVLLLVPFFVLGVVSGLATAHMEATHVGAEGYEWDYGIAERVLIAGRVPWFYLSKILWPVPVAFSYGRWNIDPSSALQWLAPVAALGLLAALWAVRGRTGRGPLAAFLIFGGLLVPASGLFDVYPFRYSFVADHFQYHAMLAPIALLGASIAAALGASPTSVTGPRARRVAPALGAALCLLLGTLSWREARSYRGAEALWKATIEDSPNAWLAHAGLGHLYLEQERFEEAEPYVVRAPQLSPFVSEATTAYAGLLLKQGRTQEALATYDRILSAYSRYAKPTAQTALQLFLQGRRGDGLALANLVVRRVPDSADGRYLLGSLLAQSGSLAPAEEQFERAVRLDPDHVEARVSLARVFAQRDERSAAIVHLEQALARDPGHAQAAALLGRLRSN